MATKCGNINIILFILDNQSEFLSGITVPWVYEFNNN